MAVVRRLGGPVRRGAGARDGGQVRPDRHAGAGRLRLVGALVASRQPRNAIGWLLLAIAILFSLSNVVEALATRSAHPAGVVMWLDDWLSDVWICLVGV